MKISTKSFAETFAELRAEADVSQEVFGQIIGRSKNTVINYESGKTTPSRDEQIQFIKKIRSFIDNNHKLANEPNPDAYVKNQPNSASPIPNDIHGGASLKVKSVPFYELSTLPTSSMLYEILKNKPAYDIYTTDQRPTFAFKAWGYCMHPTIKDGDVLFAEIIKDIDEITANSYCLIVTKESKRIRRIVVSDKKVKLLCDNRVINEDGERIHPDVEIDKNKVLEIALILSKQSSLLP